ncbi:hypothetical protein [Endozoicomonas acroporae]|uniref:hypothetical protein n=1 Tax=Endozoicomonas acroporae TaxID=1701104 RepID=UPI003D78DC04
MSKQVLLTEIGVTMNIGNMATGLAGIGLTAAVSLNTGVADSSNLTRWRTRTVMALSGTVGISLSLLQCIREGRNMSTRTLATLAMNAGVLAYSYLQPWADLPEELMIYKSEAECHAEFLKNQGEMSMPQCKPYLHKAEVIEKMVEQIGPGSHRKIARITKYNWKE